MHVTFITQFMWQPVKNTSFQFANVYRLAFLKFEEVLQLPLKSFWNLSLQCNFTRDQIRLQLGGFGFSISWNYYGESFKTYSTLHAMLVHHFYFNRNSLVQVAHPLRLDYQLIFWPGNNKGSQNIRIGTLIYHLKIE